MSQEEVSVQVRVMGDGKYINLRDLLNWLNLNKAGAPNEYAEKVLEHLIEEVKLLEKGPK